MSHYLSKGIRCDDRVFLKQAHLDVPAQSVGIVVSVKCSLSDSATVTFKVPTANPDQTRTAIVPISKLSYYAEDCEAYKILRDSDTVELGDEFIIRPYGMFEWRKVNAAGFTVRERRRRIADTRGPRGAWSVVFRRKVPVANPGHPFHPNAKAPEGYRLLGPAEVVVIGDQFTSFGNEIFQLGWITLHQYTWVVGKTALEVAEAPTNSHKGFAVARKIEVPAPAAPAPKSPEGTPPTGFRWLVEGEIVAPGDGIYRRADGNVYTNVDKGSGYNGHRVGDSPSDFTAFPFVRAIHVVKSKSARLDFGTMTVERLADKTLRVSISAKEPAHQIKGWDFSEKSALALAQLIHDTK